MSDSIVDQDVSLLAAVAATLKQDYVREGAADPWAGSPFAWIRTVSSRRRGTIGEQLVSGWCAAKGFDVTRSSDSDADRVIRIEIKFSTLWETGSYRFQQIRDQNYEYVICLGISPFNAGCWIVPKEIIWNQSPPQHGGARGSDTRWLSFPATHPPSWLAVYGGTLSQALEVLKGIAVIPPATPSAE